MGTFNSLAYPKVKPHSERLRYRTRIEVEENLVFYYELVFVKLVTK